MLNEVRTEFNAVNDRIRYVSIMKSELYASER